MNTPTATAPAVSLTMEEAATYALEYLAATYPERFAGLSEAEVAQGVVNFIRAAANSGVIALTV